MGESYLFSPLETQSVMCPPQEVGFSLNHVPFTAEVQSTQSFISLSYPSELRVSEVENPFLSSIS